MASPSSPRHRSTTSRAACPARTATPRPATSRARVNGVRVASVYVPNGTTVGSDNFAYKLRFFARLRAHAAAHLEGDTPLVIGGDYNVAPEPIDVYDPAECEGTICYHPDERHGLRGLLHRRPLRRLPRRRAQPAASSPGGTSAAAPGSATKACASTTSCSRPRPSTASPTPAATTKPAPARASPTIFRPGACWLRQEEERGN